MVALRDRPVFLQQFPVVARNNPGVGRGALPLRENYFRDYPKGELLRIGKAENAYKFGVTG